jgi:signal transduction histidine kinase
MALELQKADSMTGVPHLRAVGPDEVITPPPPVAPAPEPAELNLRLFSGLGRWLREQHGEEVLRRVLNKCGLEESELRSVSAWASVRQIEQLLVEVRELAGSDEAFEAACVYEISEGYGPHRFVFMAATPRMLLTAAMKNFHNISRVSKQEATFPGPGRVVLRYTSEVPESRLMCLSRHAHGRALTTMWGLPPSHMVEKGCIAHGDDACVYELQYYQPSAIWLPLAGALIGALVAWAASALGLGATSLWLGLPLIGGMFAQMMQLTRGNRTNLTTGEEINETLREVIEQHSDARHEILELNQRQREWTRTLERQVRERTDRLEGMVDRLRALDQARETNIRGVSHDLRNPLSLLNIETELLREKLDLSDPDVRDLVEGHGQAVKQMQALINHMMHEATEDLHRRQHAPEAMEVAPMTDVIRRRLRALVHGRELKTSVFSTREMPERIWCHPIVFDRVVDNLLTNAVKYTDRGSILVEIDGAPGFLTIKISDTGAGIDQDRLKGIFHPRGNGAATSPASYGVGLSVVVSLLDELGGKLEVMSRAGVGTTFWARFPTDANGPRPDAHIGSAVDRVVTIRRADEH